MKNNNNEQEKITQGERWAIWNCPLLYAFIGLCMAVAGIWGLGADLRDQTHSSFSLLFGSALGLAVGGTVCLVCLFAFFFPGEKESDEV